jgi:hypothetical protein
MSDKVDCPLCSISLTYRGLNRHMFSKNHSSIWNAPSLRTRLQNYYTSGAKNPIQIKTLFICFGCKTFTRRDIPHSCPNKAKTLAFIKSILDVPVRAPEPKEVTATPVPQVDVEKLKKRIEILEDDVSVANTKCERAEDLLDGLKFWIKFTKSENPELHETIMSNFQEEFGSVIPLLKLI